MKLPNDEQSRTLLAAAVPMLEVYGKQLGCQMVCAQLSGNSDLAKQYAERLQNVAMAAVGVLGQVEWGMAKDHIEVRFPNSNIVIRYDAGGDFTVGIHDPGVIITE